MSNSGLQKNRHGCFSTYSSAAARLECVKCRVEHLRQGENGFQFKATSLWPQSAYLPVLWGCKTRRKVLLVQGGQQANLQNEPGPA